VKYSICLIRRQLIPVREQRVSMLDHCLLMANQFCTSLNAKDAREPSRELYNLTSDENAFPVDPSVIKIRYGIIIAQGIVFYWRRATVLPSTAVKNISES